MNTSRFELTDPVDFHEEVAGITAHALGVTLDSTADSDMKRFERIDRERLLESHGLEVTRLNAQIEMLAGQAADFRHQIGRLARRENRLMLALAGVAMLVAYFYLRDFACAAPSWTNFRG